MPKSNGDITIIEANKLPVPAVSHGEGPHWDAETGSLYWVDISEGQVHRLGPDGEHASWRIGQPASAVVPRAGGGLLVAAGAGFVVLDPATAVVTELATAEPDRPGNRMNDGACDRAGRFYAGTMAIDESPELGALYRLDPDLTVTELITGVGISNGIGWSPDERLMYYIDSHIQRVDVLDYDAGTGAIGNRRPFAHLGPADGVPDGLAVDSEGGVWVAVWGGYRVLRYSASGELTAMVRLPAARVSSCAFGGSGLDELYITTAAGPGQSAGALFGCAAGITGMPTYPFRG